MVEFFDAVSITNPPPAGEATVLARLSDQQGPGGSSPGRPVRMEAVVGRGRGRGWAALPRPFVLTLCTLHEVCVLWA